MPKKSGHAKYRKLRQTGQCKKRAAGFDESPQDAQGLPTMGANHRYSMWTYFALGLACTLALFLGLEFYQFVTAGKGIFAVHGAAQLSDAEDEDAFAKDAPRRRIHAKASLAREKARLHDEDAGSNPDVTGLELVREDGSELSVGQALQLAGKHDDYTLRVDELLQYPELPSGCEPVSLTIVLRSMGFDLGQADIVEKYLSDEKAAETGYYGSPYGEGGCFPPVMVKVANSYLADQHSELQAHDLTGSGFAGLLELARRGYPVLVWTTMAMEEPIFGVETEDGYKWYLNEHCVVLYGADGEHVLISDPLEGLVERDLADFARLYEDCGSYAAYIH